MNDIFTDFGPVRKHAKFDVASLRNQVFSELEAIKYDPSVSTKIPLRNGLYVLIDRQDIGVAENISWSANRAGTTKTLYARGLGGSVFLHRLIMGNPVGKIIDHVNHCGLDNRRCNLRVVSHRGNYVNSRTTHRGSTKLPDGSYQTQIQVLGRKFYLGQFESEQVSQSIYHRVQEIVDYTIRKLHGDEMCLPESSTAERRA